MKNKSNIGIWKFNCPKGWKILDSFGNGYMLRHNNGLAVIIDCSVKEDSYAWIHCSISRSSKVPSHKDLLQVKDQLIGKDQYTYFIFPPQDKYVNIHPNCLHLWSRTDDKNGKVLPEFSGTLCGIRTI